QKVSTKPRQPKQSPLFPYTTLFRSKHLIGQLAQVVAQRAVGLDLRQRQLIRGKTKPAAIGAEMHGTAHQRLIARRVIQRRVGQRSEEHTSELQSREKLVCRLLLEKK